MKKSLLSGLFWVLLANLIVKPFWILGIEVGVQNAVGTEMYGFYFAIFNITYIFNILLDVGVTNFNTRNIAQHPQLINKHLSGILGIKLLLLVLYLVVTFSVGALLGYSSRQFYLLAWLSFNQFLNSLILYLRSNFEGLLLFKWDSLFSVLDRLLMIVICGLLLWTNICGSSAFRIEWFVYAQTAAYLITALLALFILSRRTRLRRLRFDKLFTLAILKKSLPFALLVLLMASYNRIDPILLQKLSPAANGNFQAGLYAEAFRLLDALTMIAYLVSVPLLPIYSKMVAQGPAHNAHAVADVTRMMFSLVVVFSVTAAVTFATMSHELMALLWHNGHLADTATVFSILIYGIIPISMTYIFGTLLTANGSLRTLNMLAAISLVINILINLLTIPRWGAAGSAWASLGAQSFMAISQMVVALRLFSMPVRTGYILKLTAFALIVVAVNVLMPVSVWWTRLIISAAVALTVAFALRLVNVNELINIIKE